MSEEPPSQLSLRTVWSRSSLAWVVGLIAPLAALSIHFKLVRIGQRRIEAGAHGFVGLLFSDFSTVLAWTFVSLGLVGWAERHAVRRLVCVALQALGVLYAGVLLGAHGYFMSTGTSLDYPMLSFALSHLAETAKVIASARSPGRLVAFGTTVVCVCVLPWWLARFHSAERKTRASDRWLGLLHAWSVAGALLALAIGVRSEQGIDLSRDPLLNIALTIGSEEDEALDDKLVQRAQKRPLGATRLEKTASTREKNVVIILLESTGAWATSLYGGPYATTPFLAELAAKALVVERMYAVEPHTSKALTATLCGIDPRPGIGVAEALEGGIPATCLPELLRPLGYHSAFYQAATGTFENRAQLVRNMGFDEFVSGDEMSSVGLRMANYFGYEDRILVKPIASFLEQQKKRGVPFLLTVLTNTPHHEYKAPAYYGRQSFAPEPLKNRYLNAVRYQDFVLRDILASFERAGALDDTVFLLLGDHGEGFGQHGRYSHDDTVYEEGLQIPFVIYEPAAQTPKGRFPGVYNELDVVPTVLDMLSLRVAEGSYVGSSVFRADTARVLYASCFNDNKCVARFEGVLKFIHHFGRQADQLFDIERDPLETRNLAARFPEKVARMRADVVDWYRVTRAVYRRVADTVSTEYVSRTPPKVQYPKHYRFGDYIEFLGYSLDRKSVRPTELAIATYHFRVLKRLPEGYHLFVHAWDGKRRFVLDHVPVQRLYPEDSWRPGQYVSDPHRLRPARDFEGDRMILRGGFVHPERGRLLVMPFVPGNDPVLAEVSVER